MPTIREISFVWPTLNTIIRNDAAAPILSAQRRTAFVSLHAKLRPVVETAIPNETARLLATIPGGVKDKTDKAKFETDLAKFKDGDAGVNLNNNEDAIFDALLYIALANGYTDFPLIPEPTAAATAVIGIPRKQ